MKSDGNTPSHSGGHHAGDCCIHFPTPASAPSRAAASPRVSRPPRLKLLAPFASVVAATNAAAILGAELAWPAPAESLRGSDARSRPW